MSTNAPQTFPPGPPLSQLVEAPTPAPPRIRTDNTETLANALQRVQELEAENRELRAKLETATEALTGAQNIVRELRDRDSDLPSLVDSHHGQVAG